MKYKLIIPLHIKLPNGHAFETAYIRGAIAAHSGKELEDNPYRGAGYRFQWERGFGSVKSGIVKVEEHDA